MTLTLLDILLLATPVLLIWYTYNFYTYWRRRGVLQETPLPIWGNCMGLGKTKHFCDINRRLYKQFKGRALFGGVYVFIKKAVLLVDLDLIKQVLIKDFANFQDRGVYNNAKDDPLTGHLVTLEGEEWRAMRHKLTPVFTSAKMKYMFATVVRVAEEFAKVVGTFENNETEVRDICSRYTADVIGTCVFGIESHSLNDPQEEFRKRGQSVFTDRRHPAIIEQFMFLNPKVAKKFHVKFLKDDLTKYFMDILRQTIDYRLKHNVKNNDFMDLLMDLRAEDENIARETERIDFSQGLTFEQLAAQAFSFFVAGLETSSTTMAFCLYELARHQENQEQLRQEILEKLKANNGELNYEGMRSMLYLEQVLNETLRLHPVVPHLARVSQHDYHIPNSMQIIEKDTMILIPIEAIHHDPEYYEEPESFKPERFQPSECEKRHSCAYLPFGDGPRNCIGLRFGKMQAKIGLISLLRSYRVECAAGTEIPPKLDNENMFVSPKNGIVLKIIKIK